MTAIVHVWAKYRWQMLSWAILLVLLGLVEYWVGWGKVLAPWRSFNLLNALLALGLLVAGYALRAWRLYDYFPAAMGGRWAGAGRQPGG